jgi:hypothetical protein
MNKDRLWLCVDSTLKKLMAANHWATSIDGFKNDLESAIESLKKVKNQIEEENDSKNQKNASKRKNS